MIIIRYILKNHAIPFLFSVFILISVFLLQFLMKFADRLVGKGLSAWVIFQLIIYNLAWMIVLVVPMAVLIACLMAFGGMSQNNEISILKASGISLYKMIIPPLVASLFVAIFLIYFNNNIYPNANHAARLLMEDISRKKPTLSLVPGVFSQDIPNYSILVREINQNKNELRDVTIYDYNSPPKMNVITAENGKIYYSTIQKKIVMDLDNGEIHESDRFDEKHYRKLRFKRHKIAMPAEQFSFEQTTPGGQRGDRELSAQDMILIVDSLEIIQAKNQEDLNKVLLRLSHGAENLTPISKQTTESSSYIYLKMEQKLKENENSVFNMLARIDYTKQEINRFWVEIHKKYSLPFACLVFVLIGAPLGTMMRKGGFGMAAGISLVFFLIYWAFLIGGEKLADRGIISPFIGIWIANILLGILGLFLLIKSAREKVTLNFDFITNLIPKSWKAPEPENENS